MNASDLIKSLSPIIGTVLGGPVGGVLVPAATNWLAEKLGLETKTVEAVADAIQGLDPEKRIALEQDFAKWQAEFSLRQDSLYIADVQSARARDAEFLKAGKRNTRADLIVLATFLALILVLVLSVTDDSLSEYAKGALSTALGLLISEWKTITQFEFGSTRSNRSKDDTINNLSKV